jgi:hypothetical protein
MQPEDAPRAEQVAFLAGKLKLQVVCWLDSRDSARLLGNLPRSHTPSPLRARRHSQLLTRYRWTPMRLSFSIPESAIRFRDTGRLAGTDLSG